MLLKKFLFGIVVRLLVIASVLLLLGCAGKLMQEDTVDYNMKLENGKVAIIFVRNFASNSAPIAEYKNGNVFFVGNSTSGSVIMHITDAGYHEYVIAGGGGSVVKANLKAGHYYYVYLLHSISNKGSRTIVEAEPYEPDKSKAIPLGGDNYAYININKLKSDLKYNIWQKNTEEGYEWFEKNKPSFISKYNYAYRANNIKEVTPDMGVTELIK